MTMQRSTTKRRETLEQHKKLYRSEELLRRVQRNLKDLQEVSKEIDAYLELVAQRRADNRSAIEQALKLDLNLNNVQPIKGRVKHAKVSR
jgi:hypothetical protein